MQSFLLLGCTFGLLDSSVRETIAEEVKLPSSQFAGVAPAFNTAALAACFLGSESDSISKQIDRILAGEEVKDNDSQPFGNSCGDPGDPQTNYSCSDFEEEGLFSMERVREVQELNDQIKESLSCKRDKLNRVNRELSCLSEQGKQIQNQLNTLKTVYLSNIQRFQRDIQNLDDTVSDRDEQLKNLGEKLIGDPSIQQPGLLAVQAEVRKIFEQMPAQIREVDEQFRAAEAQRKILANMVQTRKMALVRSCATNQTYSGYRCSRNGPSVTFIDYLECRYDQEARRGRDGSTIERDQETQNKARARARELRRVMDTVIGRLPKDASLPSSPDEAAQFANQSLEYLSFADMKAQLSPVLKKFDTKWIKVSSFFFKSLENCFARANRVVAREQDPNRESSPFRQIEFRIRQLDRTANTQMERLINLYSEGYTDMTKALTGNPRSLNVSGCKSAKPTTRVGCLNEMKALYESTLKGSDESALANMEIRGNKPETTIRFQCAGLNGCVAALQRVKRNIDAERRRVADYRRNFVNLANQGIQAFTKQMATTLGPINQLLHTRLEAINRELGLALGIPGVRFPEAGGERLRGDPRYKGLYQVPTDMMALFGNEMTPPLLRIDGNSLGGSLRAVSRGVERMNRKIAQVSDVRQNLFRKAKSCRLSAINKLAQSTDSLFLNWSTNRCHYEDSICGKDKQVIPGIYNVLSQVSNIIGEESLDAMDRLNTGVADLCKKYYGRNAKLESNRTLAGEIEKDKAELEPLERELREVNIALVSAKQAEQRLERGDKKKGDTELAEQVPVLDLKVRTLTEEIAALKTKLVTKESDLKTGSFATATGELASAGDAVCSSLAGSLRRKLQLYGRLKDQGADSGDQFAEEADL